MGVGKMKAVFITLVILIVLVGILFELRFLTGETSEELATCTEEAKLCSNGSYVFRTPPKCGFADCSEGRAVKLYYYNPQLDKDDSGDIACSRNGLIAVERRILTTKTPIQDTVNLLLSGKLTDKEQARGIGTEYPLEEFSLKGASLEEGVLTLEFDDPNNKTVGGSCRAGILWFQIEATAKQFPEVREVRFLPEYIFQP